MIVKDNTILACYRFRIDQRLDELNESQKIAFCVYRNFSLLPRYTFQRAPMTLFYRISKYALNNKHSSSNDTSACVFWVFSTKWVGFFFQKKKKGNNSKPSVVMSLAHASDDSLRQILSLLTGKDVMQLMATGSRRLMARVALNTTQLFWPVDYPTLFPSCSFGFRNLRSLIIKADFYGGHLSLNGPSMFPQEPMASLEMLDWSFPTCHLIFEPHPSHRGMKLSSAFPKLTSLTVYNAGLCTIAKDWPETLPQSLLSLSMHLYLGGNADDFLSPSLFSKLPLGLQHLEFSANCPIGAGEIDVRRFTDLRVLRLCRTQNWTVLRTLPDSLQELKLHFRSAEPYERFPLSQLPRGLRILDIDGARGFELEFDSLAPVTLEEFGWNIEEAFDTEKLLKFFPTRNLRKLRGVPLTLNALKALPNLESDSGIDELSTDLPSLEVLPRKLKTLWIREPSPMTKSFEFKHLPSTLTALYMPIWRATDLCELPPTLSTLQCFAPNQPRGGVSFPAAVWRHLPPYLRTLKVYLSLFESEECFQVLPETLESLSLTFSYKPGIAAMVDRIKFSKSLQASLKELNVFSGFRIDGNGGQATGSLVSKLSDFSRLTTIRINSNIVITNSTLSNLPKSLVDLSLYNAKLENVGLSVFSLLPDALRRLSISISSKSSDTIDFKWFSMLPSRLATFMLETTGKFCPHPKAFVSSLPRRITMIYYHNNANNAILDDEEMERHAAATKEWAEAIEDYYADPFWLGRRQSLTGVALS